MYLSIVLQSHPA